MKMNLSCLPGLALGLALTLAGPAAAAPPAPFEATYQVLQHGQVLGEAQVSLRRADDGQWVYRKHMQGTGGLAALLGAELDETSRFRWNGERPEAIDYDYRFDSAIKRKQRHLKADWKAGQVSVDEGHGIERYPTKPGMVERNTTALAIGVALRDGSRQMALPVAVRQRVETQRFAVSGKETVQVPAGTFDAVRVDRTDAAKNFSAWYVPGRYVLPVKLAQRDGGSLTMQLVRVSTGQTATPGP